MKKLISFLTISLLFTNCTKDATLYEPEIEPLVQLDDITISKDEFIKRAEYTIRPPYCKNNYNIHKKIVLNSLIAEKLFAKEVNKDSLISSNKQLTNYITGRKNQAIRQLHYYNEGTKKVSLEKETIDNVYQKAGRKYNLVFLSLPSIAMSNEFLNFLNKEQLSFEQGIGEFLGKNELPIKEMTYDQIQNRSIHNILYQSKIDKSKIYGPIKTLAGNAILFKVHNWSDKKAMAEQQIQTRYNDVKETLARLEADQIYAQYVGQLMRGKQVDFNRETFMRLSLIYSQLYDIHSKNNKKMVNNELWGKKDQIKELDSLQQKFEKIEEAVLFSLDGEYWQVKDFQKALLTHPLVFRKKDISGKEFPTQFRLAIADLIRDQYITADAYQKGYHQLKTVATYTQMWEDNAVSNFYRDTYLSAHGFDQNFTDNYMEAINNYLNPLVDSLQAKYSKRIYIDTDLFNDIKLTRIDMLATQKNVPYPIIVPSFPIITNDSRLDYGNKLNQ